MITVEKVYLAASAWDMRCSVISVVRSVWKPQTKHRYSMSSFGRLPTVPVSDDPAMRCSRFATSKYFPSNAGSGIEKGASLRTRTLSAVGTRLAIGGQAAILRAGWGNRGSGGRVPW